MRRLIEFVRRNQMVQFALVAGAVFLFHSWSSSSSKPEIVVSQNIVEDLVGLRSEVVGYELNEQERQELINTYIDDEVLLREAYALGLDRNDTKLRERLIAKMRFLLSQEVEEPSTATLRSFYSSHLDLYLKPSSVTFEQVFFETSTVVESNTDLLARIINSSNPAALGDMSIHDFRITVASNFDLNVMFGEEFVDSLLKAKIGEWEGPHKSKFGFHFVRLIERPKSAPYAFEEIRELVREDWSVFQSEEHLKKELARLKEQYSITVVK